MKSPLAMCPLACISALAEDHIDNQQTQAHNHSAGDAEHHMVAAGTDIDRRGGRFGSDNTSEKDRRHAYNDTEQSLFMLETIVSAEPAHAATPEYSQFSRDITSIYRSEIIENRNSKVWKKISPAGMAASGA
jgi:hypothetical protein